MLGEMTVSMLRGEQGNQVKEIRKLTEWLRAEAPPDVVTLPNSLLIGLARPIREAVRRPVSCTFAGDELFLSQLIEPYRSQSLELIRANLHHCDGFVALSRYNAAYWSRELGIPESRIHVVPLGIGVEDFHRERAAHSGFRVGYFARIAPEKGLEQLARGYIRLRRETDFSGASLEAAGYMAPEHRGYLRTVERLFQDAGMAAEFHYRGELDRAQKVEFLRSIDLLSVPATYDEPKGLFLLEAMANGTPVVQPRRGAFTEFVEDTGGGILVNPDDDASLAQGIYTLWKDPALAAELGRRGADAVRRRFTVSQMAERAVEAYRTIAMARAGNA
jgi:glycosyltransferase involved in cell wall biosynthesis